MESAATGTAAVSAAYAAVSSTTTALATTNAAIIRGPIARPAQQPTVRATRAAGDRVGGCVTRLGRRVGSGVVIGDAPPWRLWPLIAAKGRVVRVAGGAPGAA